MMIQIDHRESRDVDIFLSDPQLLAYLDPSKRDFAFDTSPSGYGGDGTNYLKISFDAGEIDFIVGQPRTERPSMVRDIEGVRALIETVPEIIAKKVFYRGRSIRPRDIFDIAAAAENDALPLVTALRRYRREVATTLESIDKMNPAFVRAAISQLMIKKKFSSLAATSIERAKELLLSV